MINTSYTALNNKETISKQKISATAKSVQNGETVTQKSNTYNRDGVVLTLSGQTDFVRIKSVGTTARAATGSTTLKAGSRGAAVATLQQNLTKLGYDTKGTDGIFGNDTKNAVISFQKAYGLTADGIVGSATQNAIAKALDYHNRGILTVGSRGTAVEALQKNLTKLGYDTKGTDGIFGNDTKNAVIAFQRANGLTADGIVGSTTQSAIEKALANRNNGILIYSNGKNLSLGSCGEEVTTLQKNLTKLGYDTKGIDGFFGNDTKNAVMSFQRVCGLKADGIVGSATKNAIEKVLDYHNKGILAKGCRGAAVATLQRNLTELGYDTKGTDGTFGENTKKAVQAFQRAYGLTEDGVVGAVTKNAIAKALADRNREIPTYRKGGNLSLGSRGTAVATLQKNLTKLGYDTKGIDGIFDNDTKNAVMAFQRANGLKQDGIVGKETQEAIRIALREAERKQTVPTEPSASGIPQFQGQDDLGYLSAKFEARLDCGCISPGTGDRGGKSYGMYQFAANIGTPQSFIQWLKDKDIAIYNKLNDAYNKDGECGVNFDEAWRSVAEEDANRFSELQYNYTKEKYYDKSVNKILEDFNFDVTKRSYALNTVIWSRAVQMGGCGTVFGRAVEGMDLSTATDEEIIRALYKECSRLTSTAPHSKSNIIKPEHGDAYGITGKYLVYFSASASKIQTGVYNRLTNTELNEALKLLEQFG